MFNIICILDNSQFSGLIEEVERETEWAYERTVAVYGHAGQLVFPKKVWKRCDELPSLEVIPALDKYPGDETH